jgi:hypothetical protein
LAEIARITQQFGGEVRAISANRATFLKQRASVTPLKCD